MKSIAKHLAVAAGMALMGGCATTATDSGQSADAAATSSDAVTLVAEPACFNARTVRNFNALSDRHVYVEGRRDEHYLLTMFNVCFGLRSAFGIALSNDFSRVCSNTGETIYYRDFGRMEACRVRDVEAVASRDAAREIMELRRASR